MLKIVKAACVAFVLAVIYSVIPFNAGCREIYTDVFRFHILANSDSAADQSLKLKVRDRVLSETKALFNSAKSKEEAQNLVSGKLQFIADAAYDEVLKNGSDYKVTAQITNMYFNTRKYKNYTLPPGMYDALRVTIGKGEGHNWWCVMYPSLCLSPQPDEEAKRALDQNEYDVVHEEKTEYKFKIIEFFEKIRSFFT